MNKKDLKLKSLQKLSLIAIGISSLVACGGGGGGSSGGSTPIPTPSPTPSPSSNLKPLVFTQDTLNIDKVGQHRLWHLTVTNPNNFDVIIDGHLPYENGQVSISPYLEVDPATPYGPTDPTYYAVKGGSNNCLDIINKPVTVFGENSGLKAGQSCTYTFNALWALNIESQTQFSFNLRYQIYESANAQNRGVVAANCQKLGYGNQCLTGTNNPITYTLLNVSNKVNLNNGETDTISLSGNYLWSQTYGLPALHRKPLTYNSNTNNLTIGSIDYTDPNSLGNGDPVDLTPNYNGNIAYSGASVSGSSVSDYYNVLPEQSYYGTVANTVVGRNNVVYSNWGSNGIGSFEYVYPLNTATNTISSNNRLPDPVSFQGYGSFVAAVDVNSNILGVGFFPEIDDWYQVAGCFIKNGAGYNNFVKLNTSGLGDYPVQNPQINYNYPLGFYSHATDNNYYNFSSFVYSTGPAPRTLNRRSLVDITNCRMSPDNYYSENGYFAPANNASAYTPNSQFVLVSGIINGVQMDTYILPASMMSNGLDGQ